MCTYEKTTFNAILNCEKQCLPLRSGTTQGCSLSLLPFSIVLEVLNSTVRPEKEMKGIQIGNEEVKRSLFADALMLYIEL